MRPARVQPEGPAGETVEVVERNPLGPWGAIAAGLFFFVASVFILIVPPGGILARATGPGGQVLVGLGGLGLGGGGLVLGIRSLVRPRVLLRYGPAGVTVDRYPPVEWTDIESIVVRQVNYGSGAQLLLRLRADLSPPRPRRGVVAPLLHLIGGVVVWGPGPWLPVRNDTAVAAGRLRDRLIAARRRYTTDPPT